MRRSTGLGGAQLGFAGEYPLTMAGYAASAKLRSGVPRFVGSGSVAPPRAGFNVEAADPWFDAAERIELVGFPFGQRLADWLASLGEACSQMTFYLFDPQSWR